MSHRPLETKLTNPELGALIRQSLNMASFLAIVVRSSLKARIVFDCHQVKTVASPKLKSGNSLLRFIEKLGKRFIDRQVDTYFVYDFPLKESLLKCFLKTANAPTPEVVVVPAIVSPTPRTPLGNPSDRLLRIAIPGRIDSRRRDYDWLHSVPENVRAKIHVSLAGSARDASDRAVFDKLQCLGFAYDSRLTGDYLDQTLFDTVCRDADVHLAPLIPDFGTRRIGQDTTTGALWDAVYYRKPLLLPSKVQIGAVYESSVFRYSCAEALGEQLCKLASEPKELERLVEVANRNFDRLEQQSKDFTRQVFRQS